MSLKPYFSPDKLEVGTDEAGLGPLFGPIYAGAVIWPPEVKHTLINDSKQLTKRRRMIAYDFVREEAIAWAVGSVGPDVIDQINNKQAGMQAMHKAIDQLGLLPEHILVDGNYFKFYMDRTGETVPHTCIVNGDAKFYSIAAASIVAKVNHDMEIERLCNQYPYLEKYGLRSNMGYGSAQHCQAIAEFGPSDFHRKSFAKVREYV